MDMTVYRNTTYDVEYRHTDGFEALPLIGCTVYFTVKPQQWDTDMADSSALIQKTITSHTDAEGGLTEWTLNDTDTNIEPGKYYYDLIVEDASGKSLPASLRGKFTVKPTVTNRNVGNE